MFENEKYKTVKSLLLSYIVQYAYKYNAQKPFTLSSGKESPFYIDCKQVTMRGVGMQHIASLIHEIIRQYNCYFSTKAIGGVTMGADSIAAAYAYYDGINMFSVRKEYKEHGMTRMIEGPSISGKGVIIVEDVVTTGGSTLHAISACLNNDANILGIIPLIDRQEHDYKSLWQKYLPKDAFIYPILTLEDIQDTWNKQQLH